MKAIVTYKSGDLTPTIHVTEMDLPIDFDKHITIKEGLISIDVKPSEKELLEAFNAGFRTSGHHSVVYPPFREWYEKTYPSATERISQEADKEEVDGRAKKSVAEIYKEGEEEETRMMIESTKKAKPTQEEIEKAVKDATKERINSAKESFAEEFDEDTKNVVDKSKKAYPEEVSQDEYLKRIGELNAKGRPDDPSKNPKYPSFGEYVKKATEKLWTRDELFKATEKAAMVGANEACENIFLGSEVKKAHKEWFDKTYGNE